MKKVMTAFLFLLCSAVFANSSLLMPGVVTSQLAKAIKNVASDASILKSGDLDISSCGHKKDPGIIEADFLGNGSKDYAVLLKIGKVEDTVYENDGNSYPWKKLRVWLVVFLGQTDGSFKPIILEKVDNHSYPAYIFVERIKPGPIKDYESGKSLTLHYSGIGLAFCEKSESVYYWDESSKKFLNVGISD